MSPSAISNGVVALLACGVGGSAAFAPPSTFPPSSPRHAGAMASAAASDLDAGEITSAKNIPLSPLSSPSSSSLPYIRIQKRGRHYDVQTAVTTFQKRSRADGEHIMGAPAATVDLHAQIHFGDAAYFRHFNDDAFDSQYDRVLYELIVEDKFLSDTDAPGLQQLTPASPGSTLNPIAPTQSDRATAAQYGLQCQVDGIQYCREGWVHADLTREEFLGWLKSGEQQKQKAPSQSANSQQPLWALASTAATYPGAELVTSLLRPLTTTSNSASAALTRRLFTHLFLPGDALSGWIRAALWLGVPSPELSILLVDWSSLSHIITRGRRRGGKGDDESKNVAPISPIAAPVLLSLLTGNWGTARRLVFGQVLVGGQSGEDSSKGGVLIDKRNERAMEVLKHSLDGGEGQKKRVALLYGAGHCRDLHRRLQDEGLTPVRTEWRTAFRATAPRWGDFVATDLKAKSRDIASTLPAVVDGENIVKSMSVSTLESVAVGLVILPLYLLIGGLDWVSTLGDLGNALDGGMYVDAIASVLLYLVRHVALYVGISKFVVDWGGSDGVFEEE
ncbi:hypothetical protein ACHAXT_009846 [Thalassiosira profunda]